MPLPPAIYFETSALWPVAHRRDDPTFQTLQKYADILEIPLYTTQLVLDELAQKYRVESMRSKSTLESAMDAFARRGLVQPSVTWPTPFSEIMDRLPEAVRGNLDSYSITILPNLKVDQERLLSMARTRELPFTEKGEKGFRDAVILFTFLAHARANLGTYAMIITDDDAVTQAASSLPEAEGLLIQTGPDIASALLKMREFLDELVREQDEERRAACREVVLRHREMVDAFIEKHAEFTETMFQDQLPLGEYAIGVEEAKLKDLQIVAVGELPRKQHEGRVKLSIEADLSVKVRVSRTFWPEPKRFRVGTESQEDSIAAAIKRRMNREGSREVQLKIRLEGSIHVHEESGEEDFSDVQLDSFNPGSTALGTLLAALSGQLPELPDVPDLE